MSLSMYQASVPVFLRMLNTLSNLLDRAQAHAEAKKFDANNFVSARVFPDMLPFAAQIRIASDVSKLCCQRITGIEAPKFEDNETTLAELKQRVEKTAAYLKTVPASALDGTEDKPVTIKVGGQDTTFKAQDYLLNFALPNVYFHTATAYGLLRSGGVEIGKRDFLNLGYK